MRSFIVGASLLVVGVLAIVFGILPANEALAVAERVWPILLFVVAITVVTELAAESGLFDELAYRAAVVGRGRTIALWLFVVALAIVATIFLSIDTTAVLLTPVVVVLAQHVGVSPLPFAFATVWLANTASLLLPVSNLTNLLAESRVGEKFAEIMWMPAAVAIVVPTVILALVFRRDLSSRYESKATSPAADRVLLWSSGIVVAILMPTLVSGIPVWLSSLVAALVLVIIFAVRRRSAIRLTLIPFSLIVLASGLFLVVEALHSIGLSLWLGAVAGSGEGPVALIQIAAVGALSANLVNNLPAYLALEPVAHSSVRIAALLIGVNAGALITPWASLATLLWHQRLTSLGVDVPWKKFVLLGLAVGPLTVGLSALALWASSQLIS